MGHTWPKYPAALLPSVEVQSHNRCLISFCWYKHKPSLASFSGFSIGRLTGQRSCMTLLVWWTPTFLTIARRSPGVSWAFIYCLSSIISTGKSQFAVHYTFKFSTWSPNCKSSNLQGLFSLCFFICCPFPAKVWSTPWLASNRKETFVKVQEDTRNKWTQQFSPSPCILPITGLAFWRSDLGQNKKPSLSDNVNVSVASARLYCSIPDTTVWRLDTFVMD